MLLIFIWYYCSLQLASNSCRLVKGLKPEDPDETPDCPHCKQVSPLQTSNCNRDARGPYNLRVVRRRGVADLRVLAVHRHRLGSQRKISLWLLGLRENRYANACAVIHPEPSCTCFYCPQSSFSSYSSIVPHASTHTDLPARATSGAT